MNIKKLVTVAFYGIIGITLFTGIGCKRLNKKGASSGTSSDLIIDSQGNVDFGAFGLSADDQGRLLNADGELIFDGNGNPVYADQVWIDGDGNLIGPDGDILTNNDGSPLTPSSTFGDVLGPRLAEDMEEVSTSQYAPIYFAYDSNRLNADQQFKVQQVADFLNANRTVEVVVEGHTDERGSADYNLGLGERRALAVRDALIRSGVEANRIHTNTYGEEQPVVMGHDESAWSQNRRVEFIFYQ